MPLAGRERGVGASSHAVPPPCHVATAVGVAGALLPVSEAVAARRATCSASMLRSALGLLTARQTKGAEKAGGGDTALPQLHGGGVDSTPALVIEHGTVTVHDGLEVSERSA